MFCTFEGIDGSGKSTVIKIVAKRLREAGHDVLETREPGGSKIGMQLKKILYSSEWKPELYQQAELLLFLADRAQHIAETIQPALRAKKIVLCDRYSDSTRVYQEGLNELLISHVETVIPDLTFLLDLDPKIARKRMCERNDMSRFDQMDDEYFTLIRNRYLTLAKDHSQRIRVINADRTIKEIVDEIVEYCTNWLEKHTEKL